MNLFRSLLMQSKFKIFIFL
uniref:Uncharacterized protein n=1 Tax=Rhizophora mucronata TaxID=61149 RepID=A0A2P2QBI1_RHIMU